MQTWAQIRRCLNACVYVCPRGSTICGYVRRYRPALWQSWRIRGLSDADNYCTGPGLWSCDVTERHLRLKRLQWSKVVNLWSKISYPFRLPPRTGTCVAVVTPGHKQKPVSYRTNVGSVPICGGMCNDEFCHIVTYPSKLRNKTSEEYA
jgi:hypothetical protein